MILKVQVEITGRAQCTLRFRKPVSNEQASWGPSQVLIAHCRVTQLYVPCHLRDVLKAQVVVSLCATQILLSVGTWKSPTDLTPRATPTLWYFCLCSPLVHKKN